jgi:endonuclease/exonuclease/phosphatase family metal-dependent hydrolase
VTPVVRRYLPAAVRATAITLLLSAGTSHADGLTLATWNMDWLMSPQTRDVLGATCVAQQPRSSQRAMPCTPGRPLPPTRTSADFDALARNADALLKGQGTRDGVDVVALQEVDGPDAAKLVFRQGWRLDCFVQRQHPQKVGFAIRDGLPYRCNGDLPALDVDGGTRAGADMTLWPGTRQEVRLLAVHLKSGCFDGKLDRSFNPCAKLRLQVPVVEAWIDQRVREGVAFAVLGDFNRHLDKDARYLAGPDETAPFNLMQAWSDNNPPGAELLRATEGQPYLRCDLADTHKQYIDDILIDRKLADRNKNRRFARLRYDDADQGRMLSDHCPVIWSMKP